MQLLQLIDLYFHVCEVYDNRLISECFRHTKNGIEPDFTDPEVLTCYLLGVGWERRTSIRDIHNLIKEHYLDCFPNIPGYSAFNYRLNRLSNCLPLLVEYALSKWVKAAKSMATTQLLTDSFPVVLANWRRRPKVAPGLSDKGFCAVKGMFYQGVKVHVTAWEQADTIPIPAFITITPASVNDFKAQKHVYEQVSHLTLVGDKAYHAKALVSTFDKAGGKLLAPQKQFAQIAQLLRQRDAAAHKQFQRAIAALRQPIETIFSWLKHHTDIQVASRVRSTAGLFVHIFGRIAAAIMANKVILMD